MAENPATISELCEDSYYAKGHLSRIVFPDGRKMDEALTNHPLAPEYTQQKRVGKYYTGKQVSDFYRAVVSQSFCNDEINQKLVDAALQLSEAKRIRFEAESQLDQARYVKKEAKQKLEEAEDQSRLIAKSLLGAMRRHSFENGHLMQAMGSGVYFLFLRDDLIYIGQSVCILGRVGQHRDKKFDRFTFINCAKENLNDVEGFFINLLQPKLNRTKLDVMAGPKSGIRCFDDLVSKIEGHYAQA